MISKKKSNLISLAMSALFLFTGALGTMSPKVYAASQIPELLITEIMPMSQSTDDAYEYLEIYNSSDNSIDLKDYKLPFQNIDITTSKIIPPKGVLVVNTRSNTTLQNFNSYYGTSLTEDKYMTLPLVNEMLSNSSSQSILLSKDDGTVVTRAAYSTGDFDSKKSVTYKYPETGFDMKKFGQNQSPTPGSVASEQIPYDGVKVTGITLDKSVVTMEGSQTITLYATVAPATATNKSIIWLSSDSKIVEVNANGILTAKSEGVATVTAKTVEGGYTAISVVIVKRVPTTGITLDKSSVTLDVGKAVILTATVSPENATNKSVIWSSSNSSIASVDSKGVVIAKAQGAAVITAKTVDGSLTAFSTVIVNRVNLSVTGVRLNKYTLYIKEGQSHKLVPIITPENASNKAVEWKSSNTKVAEVTVDGRVIARNKGLAVITVTTKDGKYTSKCYVYVSDKKGKAKEHWKR